MKRLFMLLLTLALLAGAVGLWLYKLYEDELAALSRPLPLEAPLEYTVPKGASFARVAEDLEARGWVRSGRFFAWHARSQRKARAVKAGTYLLEPGMSAMDVLALFIAGREVLYPFTIVEGWTFRDLRVALARSPHLVQTLGDEDPATIMQRLGLAERHPEGMFLADTYLFPPRTTDLQALARAQRALERALDEAWSLRRDELPLTDPYQGLILASIIEKETAQAHERPLIAGVFVRRLREGMLLQTDPTVIYGLGDAFDGNLTREHLRTDNPYNTYTRKGLPPTPIALVGPDAIHAALNPDEDGSLYFVARGDGTHQFSRTYDEHVRAVQRYQLRGRRPAAGGGS